MLVVELPLAFVAVMLYHVVVLKAVGVPQIVPLLVPKLRPAGSVASISHEVIVPEPVNVAFNGKSMLDWPFVSVRFSGV